MSEREALLARAKELEISHPANIGEEKLKGKIAEAEAAAKAKADAEAKAEAEADAKADAKAKAKASSSLVPALVLDALKHNGTDYGPGTSRETVELTPEELAPLEACGVVQRLT
ncbi:hypothetical protein [Phaeobacter sp. 11ANDIMAR09]|uniref:hypothetical protein n=1 Tax=Phaeobacter sp. 11ANDIMAR09 TaxID=1225647 RepID=UPI0006C8902F|nr:hypothetical protein [Phaeobacter sp. 11ANDIMAR09]KPD10868.1 hypothetical protein AN476_18615 [Phaeobacter sp. 11ANDIMAR09]